MLVGSEQFLRESGVDAIPTRAHAATRRWERKARTVLRVAVDGQAAGSIALADTLKPHAREVVERAATGRGAKSILLTGDNPTTARAIGGELGLPARQILAGVLPDAKAAAIEELKRQRRAGAWPWSATA